ncbi:cornichon homolog 1-like protein [Tanacetum coccineum]
MEWILWIILFCINLGLVFSTVLQITCLSELEQDYLNPYDTSSRINAVVVPEMVAHGVWCALFLVTGHWIMFLFALPITIYNAMLYSKRQHLIDVTEVFRSLDAEKKFRLIKFAFYLLMLILVLIGLVIAGVNHLINDDEERVPRYGIF